MSSHAAKDTSARLSAVLRLLSDGQEHTTRDIQIEAGCCAVSASISELRQSGHTIDCRLVYRTAQAAVYGYRLIPDDGAWRQVARPFHVCGSCYALGNKCNVCKAVRNSGEPVSADTPTIGGRAATSPVDSPARKNTVEKGGW
jgi:hypothetical protein